MDWTKVFALGIPALKQLAADLPKIKTDLENAKTQPWWPALQTAIPNINAIDDTAISALGELSAFISFIEPLLNLFPAA